MNLDPFRGFVRAVAILAVAVGLAGCQKRQPAGSGASASKAKVEDFVRIDEDTTDEERMYLDFGRTVVNAVSARDYQKFYELLSSYAKAQMSLNQFAPEDDDAKFRLNEQQPRRDVGLEEFLQLMATAERFHGSPSKPLDLHVHSTDAAVLAGTATGGFEAIDVMFAIGNMPKLAPPSIRKASLRGSIAVDLSPEQLAETAKAYETTPDELLKMEDFQPYVNLKLVLVDENDSLKVGYFEFLPPSIMD